MQDTCNFSMQADIYIVGSKPDYFRALLRKEVK